MKKKSKWRGYGTLALAIFCVLYILPSFFEEQLPVWFNKMFKSRISYGLDIKGGLELEYTVDWKKAVLDYCRKNSEGIFDRFLETWTKKKIDEISDAERDKFRKRLLIETQKPYSKGYLLLTFRNKDDAKLFGAQWMKDNNFTDFGEADRDTSGSVAIVRIKLLDSKVQEIKKQAVKQTLEIVRKRAEGFGLAEPDVRQSGDSNIVVQLPGLKKSQMKRVKEQMGRPARLVFRIVDQKLDVVKVVGRTYVPRYKKKFPIRAKSLRFVESDDETGETFIRAESKIELVRFVRWLGDQKVKGRPIVPQDRLLSFQKVSRKNERNQVTQTFFRTWYLISKIQLDGKHVTKANVYYDKDNKPYVSLDLDSVGGRMFQKVTRKYVKRLLAIMLDEDLESAPQIREEIGGGRVRIDLGGVNSKEVLQDAQNLMVVLTHGAYKAPVYKVSENEVGPQLGKDAIDAGKLALLVGGLIVLLFIGVYYRISGIVANIALVFNVLMIMAVLVSFNSFLTLPGLAGIILTIGMAIDANVIIFERIREELRAGRSPRAALDTGYEKALWTVLDANITTALAGFVLLNLTSGPVYGFAVTLLTGIGCSVFTAIYVTRMMLNFIIEKGWMKETFSI